MRQGSNLRYAKKHSSSEAVTEAMQVAENGTNGTAHECQYRIRYSRKKKYLLDETVKETPCKAYPSLFGMCQLEY